MELQDKIDVVRCYFLASYNATVALRMFKKERNVHNDPLNTRTITRIVNRFLETGLVAYRTRSGRPGPSEETIEAVDKARERIQNCAALGNSSTKRISNEVDIPRTTVNRITRRKLNLHPYKLHCGQTLSPEQKERRVQFAENYIAYFMHSLRAYLSNKY